MVSSTTRRAGGLAVVMLLVSPLCIAADVSDTELLAGADARIEKHRKADAVVSVVDAAGKPLAGVEIEMQQTHHAFLFGSNIFTWGHAPNAAAEDAYRRRFAEVLNYATLPFYWPMYEPRRGEPSHQRTEQVARWCLENGILPKGHPLAWNYSDARWFPDNPDELFRLQLGRIDDCVKRFTGLIDRWDVVNEATHYDREEFLHRAPKLSQMWKKQGQIPFTRECFLHARQANPKATLLINDYRTDPPYEKVIEQLVDSTGRRLYDVIGIQSHMHGGVWPTKKTWETCERFARFGVPLHFTEMTIVSGERSKEKKGDWPSTPDGEARQAREAVRIYTILFSHPAVEAITWWDFSDYRAWQQAPAGWLRSDMTPKPIYDELKKRIRGQWWTNAKTTTNAKGEAAFRGFLGDYRVTIRLPGRPAVTKAMTLARGVENRLTVKGE